MRNAREFKARKQGEPIVMVSAYSAWSAALCAAEPGVDCLLVGDSVAMVEYGEPSTLHATIDMMERHTAAVARRAGGKLVVADLPFLTFRKGVAHALDCAGRLMRAGAGAVKLEGVRGHDEVVSALVGSGIPVMGHLGLTPQSVNALGYRVQARAPDEAEALRADAHRLVELGVFGVVLELVPSAVAERVTREMAVPTIGIGAGAGCDGQVLVFHDLLGLNPDFNAKFVRRFAPGAEVLGKGLADFARGVRERSFPAATERFE